MNVYIPYTRLPSTYQEVEWIQSSGTQRINTGYSITSNMRIVIDFYTPSGTTNNPILGTTYGSWRWTAPMVMNTSEGKLYIAAGSTGPSIDGYTYDTKHSLDYNSSRAILDGNTMSISATFNTSYALTLFYGNSYYGSARIYTCKVYTGDTLARNLIPCYRKSDNVIGMYDTVNNQFYTNSGTGTFSKGSDVVLCELQNAYIGEYKEWTPGANTLAYYKFDGNLNDSSGNSHTLSNTGSISYSTNPYAVNLSTSNYLYFNNTDAFNHDWTFNTWAYITARNQNNDASVLMCQGTGSQNSMIFCCINSQGKLFFGFYGNDHTGTITSSLNQWVNVCYTYNYATKTYKAYINGVKDIDGTTTQYTVASGNLYVGALANDPSALKYRVQGKLSEYILENKARTAQEISDYYNGTKSNYGL